MLSSLPFFSLWISDEIFGKGQWRILYVLDKVMLPSWCASFLLPLSANYLPSYISYVNFTQESIICSSEAAFLKKE